MSELSPADRARLAKLLCQLSSNHAGERDAAALAAHRMVVQAGLPWPQIIEPQAIEKPLPKLGTWRATVAACLARPCALRPWKLKFLRDLPGFRRLSVKQPYAPNAIADRVLHRSDAP
jgi:hypothetical protein